MLKNKRNFNLLSSFEARGDRAFESFVCIEFGDVYSSLSGPLVNVFVLTRKSHQHFMNVPKLEYYSIIVNIDFQNF